MSKFLYADHAKATAISRAFSENSRAKNGPSPATLSKTWAYLILKEADQIYRRN